MKNIKLNEFVNIRDNFQYAINLKYDIDSIDKVENYIMTPGAIEIIEETFMSFSNSVNDRAKILIGPYGKGKSHLLLVLLSMIRDLNSSSSKKLIDIIASYNAELAERINELAEEKFKMLPVVVTASSLDMKQILLNSLMETLVVNDLGHLMPESYFESAKKTINMWLNKYPSTYKAFSEELEEDMKIFLSRLENFDHEAFATFRSIYPSVTAGSEFNPLFATDIDTIFVDVAKELTKCGYNGIYLVYDEFSKFLEGSIDKNSALDIKILQDLAELCNRSSVNSQIHLMLISHKDITSYTDSLPKEKIDSWNAVSERFKRVEINNSKVQTYHLISKVLTKEEKGWNKFKKLHIKDIQGIESSLTKSGLIRGLGFASENFIEMTFPLHPLTTFILPEIAEQVAQNERTLFTFLASKEKKAIWQIVKNEDDTTIITPDIIFDYFEDQFKKENFEHQIYKTWRSSKEICNAIIANTENKDNHVIELALKVIKTLALIQMINKNEMLPPTSSNIDLGFQWNYDYDEIREALDYLISKNYIRFATGKKHYVLKSTQSIDITSLLNDQIKKRHKVYDLHNVMTSALNKEVIYPNKYNVEKEIIRYYNLKFMTSTDFLDIGDWDYYLSKEIHNSHFIAILLDAKSDYELVLTKAKAITNNLVFISVLNSPEDYEYIVRAYDAILYLIEENKLGDKDSVLDEEYNLELEELYFKLMDILDKFFDPSLKESSYIQSSELKIFKKKSQLNNALSDAMAAQYDKMPVIINEMINRDTINTTIQKASDKIVGMLIKNEIHDDLGFVGHGPEVTIMRSVLMSTGIYDGKKTLSYNNLVNENVENVLMIIQEFILSTSSQGQRSFEELYDILINPKHGIGLKKGVIPILLAVVIHRYKRYVVISKSKHEMELTVSLINDLNKHPNKFTLYLEEWNEEKEKYVNGLENIFDDYIEPVEKEYNSFDYIVKGMHRWFLYLPKYSKEYQIKYDQDCVRIDVDKANIFFRSKMRASHFNSREFLFVTLPKLLKKNEYNIEMIEEVRQIRNDIDSFLDLTKENLYTTLVNIFSRNPEKSLYNAIHDWYSDLDEITQNNKFDGGSEVLMKSVEYISNNHDEFLEIFTKDILGLSIVDWDDSKYEMFIKKVNGFKDEIELFNAKIKREGVEEFRKQSYTIKYVDESNESKEFSFSNNGFSTPQAQGFYDELIGVLDDYVYTLDKNEARQVIMEVMKKML